MLEGFKNKYLAELIMVDTLKRVPVDTGFLKNSFYIKKIGVGYMLGFNAPYAIYVHEVANRHEPPTEYKFLENAALDQAFYAKELRNIDVEVRITYEPLAVYVGIQNAPGKPLNTPGKGSNRALLDAKNIMKRIRSLKTK